MSDRMVPMTCEALGGWLVRELETRHAMAGIPSVLFFRPDAEDGFRSRVGSVAVDSPIGVAAGPHTQLAQNIVASWLCGARVIELKTVQELDELEISKPCIDMQDAGYNVEWSQELRIDQSAAEYIKAWVLIHALHRHLGFEGASPGILFNMSVGYDLEGIRKPKVQRFLSAMEDAGEAIRACREELERFFPWIHDLAIPSRLSDQVTLSTMHGCPPDEIERIASYLLRDKGLDTFVKLNPTLLGVPELETLLHDRLGFEDIQPARATCEKDLGFAEAVPMLERLSDLAQAEGRSFGIKLSNTLAVENRRPVFPPSEKEMYLSGRPLHPVTVKLALRLREALPGRPILTSFAGGADAFNVADLFACGMNAVTTCSDLLRPGSYARLKQYLDELGGAMAACGAGSLDALPAAKAGESAGGEDAALANLRAYAAKVLDDPAYRGDKYERNATKTGRTLGRFDCIQAPCTEGCGIGQQVPEYLRLIAEGRYRDAAAVIAKDNVMPCTLGKACPHPCELVCVRTHYDEPIAIRDLKRFAFDHADAEIPRLPEAATTARVAIIGAGPCGLAAASELARAGYPVTLFDRAEAPGGMVNSSIPAYRAEKDTLARDLQRIQRLGVDTRFGQRAGKDFTFASLREEGFAYIVIATGAQAASSLGLDGDDADGVWGALSFLAAAKRGDLTAVGPKVAVVGGGDVAMDCARTALRLAPDGEVSLVYRRTLKEMPAHREERGEMLEEAVTVRELLSPLALETDGDRLIGLTCVRNQLGEPDASGRRRPVPIAGSEETLPINTLVVAVNQVADHAVWLAEEGVALNRKGFIETDPGTLETSVPNVFAGGDAMGPGPATIVKAMGDGRRIARTIRTRVEGKAPALPVMPHHSDWTELMARKARRSPRVETPRRNPADRDGFDEVVLPLDEAAARREASRCLECQTLCSLCAAVCPNLAIQTYRIEPRQTILPVLVLRNGEVVEEGAEPAGAAQGYQVLVLADSCNECGNCATFCPTVGQPYRDKPRLYRTRREWEAEADNAFHLERSDGEHWVLLGRYGGQTHRLTWNGTMTYENPAFTAELNPATLAPRKVTPHPAWNEGETCSLTPAAELAVLLGALRGEARFLVEAVANP